MRSILIALTVGTVAGTVAYAHTLEGTGAGRAAGTLTCRTLSDVSLVFGTARAATCHFEARNGARQVYAAILPPRDGEGARTLAWRVTTMDGKARPGLLDGRFSGDGAVLRGDRAELSPVGAADATSLSLAAADGRLTVGAR